MLWQADASVTFVLDKVCAFMVWKLEVNKILEGINKNIDIVENTMATI